MGGSPSAQAVTPKVPAAAAQGATPKTPAAAPQATTPKAAAPQPAAAPKVAAPMPAKAPKGPPPLPPESGPDLSARPAEPMRPRLETAPGIGVHGDTPRTPPAQSREEVQQIVRAAVAEGVLAAMGEAQRLVRMLERRVEELEKRPVAVAPAPPVAAQAAPSYAQPVARAAAFAPVSAIPVMHAEPRGETLDIARIEREVRVEVDSALDGGKRKRRLVAVVVLFILLVFGGLFAMLAQSYAPHG
jgi:hypothetical protein